MNEEHFPVDVIDYAKEGFKQLQPRFQKQVAEFLKEFRKQPSAHGTHLVSRLYCRYKKNVSHVRVVWTHSGTKPVVVAIGPRRNVYDMLIDSLTRGEIAVENEVLRYPNPAEGTGSA